MTRKCRIQGCEEFTYSPQASFCDEHRSRSKRETKLQLEMAAMRVELAAAKKEVRKLKTQVAIRDCETVQYARMACELSSIDLDEVISSTYELLQEQEFELTEKESHYDSLDRKRISGDRKGEWVFHQLLEQSHQLAESFCSRLLFNQAERAIEALANADFHELLKRYHALIEAGVKNKTPKLLRGKPELKSEYAADWLRYYQSLIKGTVEKKLQPLLSTLLRSGIYSKHRLEIKTFRKAESAVYSVIQKAVFCQLESKYEKFREEQEED